MQSLEDKVLGSGLVKGLACLWAALLTAHIGCNRLESSRVCRRLRPERVNYVFGCGSLVVTSAGARRLMLPCPLCVCVCVQIRGSCHTLAFRLDLFSATIWMSFLYLQLLWSAFGPLTAVYSSPAFLSNLCHGLVYVISNQLCCTLSPPRPIPPPNLVQLNLSVLKKTEAAFNNSGDTCVSCYLHIGIIERIR